MLESLGRDVGDADDRQTLDWLVARDVDSWTAYREETWTPARAFRAAGGRTARLSNGVPEVMLRARAQRSPATWLDVVIVSSEVGLTGPDARIFELALARLDIEAGQALFVDDRGRHAAVPATGSGG